MIKIAILSDSHKKVNLTSEAINNLKSKGASYLIHAGDLELEANLQLLEKSGLPYVSVFGNNDIKLVPLQNQYNIYKEPYYFKIKEFKIKVMHLPFYMVGDTDIVVSGHTHIFEHQYINNTLFINSGEICAREKNLTECVLLAITENQYIIEYNYRRIKDVNWKTKVIKYDRK